MTRSIFNQRWLILATVFLLSTPQLFGAFLNIRYLDRDDLYAAGSVGYNHTNRNQLDSVLNGITLDQDLRPGDSYEAHGSIGYMFGHLRVEAEGGYRKERENDTIIHTNSDDTATIKKIAQFAEYTIMGNAFLDIPIYCDKLIAYIGGGAGVGFTQYDIFLTGTDFETHPASDHINDHDARFAFQLMTGLSYEINKCIAITAGYRLFGITTPTSLKNRLGIYDLQINETPLTHSFEIGVRFKLF